MDDPDGPGPTPSNGKYENPKYTSGINFDINKDGVISSGDQGPLSNAISSGRSCVSTGVGWEDNVDIGKATAGLP
jgi:hypothetical protein